MKDKEITNEVFTDWKYAPAPESTEHIKINKQYDLFINYKNIFY